MFWQMLQENSWFMHSVNVHKEVGVGPALTGGAVQAVLEVIAESFLNVSVPENYLLAARVALQLLDHLDGKGGILPPAIFHHHVQQEEGGALPPAVSQHQVQQEPPPTCFGTTGRKGRSCQPS